MPFPKAFLTFRQLSLLSLLLEKLYSKKIFYSDKIFAICVCYGSTIINVDQFSLNHTEVQNTQMQRLPLQNV